eukprot:CAMPEP_0178958646 /NCGR_PEP_ID=MMETSP0789-20121207/11760_1 /TAXON_ID=3005 /ORGANISM="Rhizosolenia setigera, Strain CCMP 1694" /LENGTH=318 /DNA_ID=CAMNT_0020641379 /DNA_START=53 /DNA_END=1009 /DNA_ORIENTATION=-
MVSDSSSSSGLSNARIIGSAVAGLSELTLFHPVDTIAKRLMSTETKIIALDSYATTTSNLNHAIFRDAATSQVSLMKLKSLFPGIGFGAAYKILQRVYKFGGQPVVLDHMENRFSSSSRECDDYLEQTFGTKGKKTFLSALSGSIIGIGEVALLPLDALKVKAQTAPEQIKGRSFLQIMRNESISSLYRGAGWTIARNAPGSFALFGGNAAMKSFLLSGDNNERGRATWTQDAIASTAGAIASITIAQPLDVIKTRIQNRPFDSPESGTQILKKLIQNEGISGFFKGLTPKIMVVGPKLIFSFTVAQHTIAYFEEKFS